MFVSKQTCLCMYAYRDDDADDDAVMMSEGVTGPDLAPVCGWLTLVWLWLRFGYR